ncbi:TPA: hypothetical protein KDY90_002574 [Vibrio parahaemolyticus]|nr:hypothetical protein [Vibrio parahaemolyticus]
MFDNRLRSYSPKWFQPCELVSREAWRKRGAKVLVGIDTRLLITIDTLREILEEIDPSKAALLCNDWVYGGSRQYSGLRLPGDKHYSEFSAHSRGKAVDLVSRYYTAEQLRQIILENRERFPYLTRMEKDVNWLHLDVFNLPESAPEGAIMLFGANGGAEYV